MTNSLPRGSCGVGALKTWDLFQSESENSFTLLEHNHPEASRLLPADAVKIWSVAAKSFEIAQMKKQEYLGWEPYKPMILSPDDLAAFLPEDKFDSDNLQLLMNLGHEAIEPVLPELLTWMQDGNWPIAQKLGPWLATRGSKLQPFLAPIFAGEDSVWKVWLLTLVLEKLPLAELAAYRADLERLQSSNLASDREEGVVEAAGELLLKLG